MVVKQHFDHSLRENGKRFLSSLKASNRYSEGYLTSLETTLGMTALYAEEQGWPDVQEITTEHIEDYLSYLQDRERWFGERTYAEPQKLSKGHINDQYRRLNRFFNWLVERKHIDENPLDDIEPPSLEEKTVPIVTEDQMRDLLTLADPALARTPAHRFRLTRDRAVLYDFLGYSRSAERNRQAATPKHRPDQRHAAGDGQGSQRAKNAHWRHGEVRDLGLPAGKRIPHAPH